MKRMIYTTLFLILTCSICHAEIRNRVEIDVSRNMLYLYHGFRCIGSYPVSTGMKEKVLINGKKYNFKTPRGRFTIYRKVEHPLWVPPDWHYDSQVVPAIKDRIPQKGKLGNYALHFRSDGLMIHGTTDETTIGQHVTHGCIRMKANDLQEVYKKCPIGTPIHIY